MWAACVWTPPCPAQTVQKLIQEHNDSAAPKKEAYINLTPAPVDWYPPLTSHRCKRHDGGAKACGHADKLCVFRPKQLVLLALAL